MLNPGIPGFRFAPETLHKLIIFQSFDIDEKHQNSAFMSIFKGNSDYFGSIQKQKTHNIQRTEHGYLLFENFRHFLFVISIEKRFLHDDAIADVRIPGKT